MDNRMKFIEDEIERYKKLSEKPGRNQAKYASRYAELVASLEDLKNIQKIKKVPPKKTDDITEGVKATVKKVEKKKKNNVYCGTKKPPKGKKLGTVEECTENKQIRLYGLNEIKKTGTGYTKADLEKLLKVKTTKRPVVKRGGKLPAGY